MDIEFLKDELERTYRVLGAELADSHNRLFLKGLLRDGYMNENEYNSLQEYNRVLYKEFVELIPF